MEDDLVISFQLLLCTLELCIKRCPSDLLQPLYSKIQYYLFFKKCIWLLRLHSGQIKWSGENTGFLSHLNEACPFWLWWSEPQRRKKLKPAFSPQPAVWRCGSQSRKGAVFQWSTATCGSGGNRRHNLTSHNGSCYFHQMIPDSGVLADHLIWSEFSPSGAGLKLYIVWSQRFHLKLGGKMSQDVNMTAHFVAVNLKRDCMLLICSIVQRGVVWCLS